MQQQSLFICLGVTALTFIVSFTVSLSPSLSQSIASESQPNKVTFFCKQIMDEASGEKIPATVAWVPERKNHVRFIGWKSEYFNKNGWTPAERCQKVTQKFQDFYETDRLNYLSNGKVNGNLVICGLANQGETCNGNNQLFTLKSGSNPEQALQRLTDIAEGKSSEVLLQNSGEQMYISVQNLFKKSPPINSKQ